MPTLQVPRHILPQHNALVHMALHMPKKLTKQEYADIIACYPWLSGIQCVCSYCQYSCEVVIRAEKE